MAAAQSLRAPNCGLEEPSSGRCVALASIRPLGRALGHREARGGSGCCDGKSVDVQLQQVVDGRDEPPLRARCSVATALEAIDAAANPRGGNCLDGARRRVSGAGGRTTRSDSRRFICHAKSVGSTTADQPGRRTSPRTPQAISAREVPGVLNLLGEHLLRHSSVPQSPSRKRCSGPAHSA